MSQIMIVEDDFRNALMVEAMMEGQQISVLRAKTGQEALDMFAKHDIKLVLLDIMLPDFDGITVTKSIRSGTNNSNVPIIAISAQTDNDLPDLLINIGCNEFLQKPFNAYKLQQMVLRYLA